MKPAPTPGAAPKPKATASKPAVTVKRTGQQIIINLAPGAKTSAARPKATSKTATAAAKISKASKQTATKFQAAWALLGNGIEKSMKWIILAVTILIAIFALIVFMNLCERFVTPYIYEWHSNCTTPAQAAPVVAPAPTIPTLSGSSGGVNYDADMDISVDAEDVNGRSTIEVRTPGHHAHVSYPSANVQAPIRAPIASGPTIPQDANGFEDLDSVPSRLTVAQLRLNPQGCFHDMRYIEAYGKIYVPYTVGDYEIFINGVTPDQVKVTFDQSQSRAGTGNAEHIYTKGVWIESLVPTRLRVEFDSHIR